MSSKTPQEAASQKSTEKNPAVIPVPKQKALVINEPSQTRRSEKRAVSTDSSKGKEKLVAEKPLKRLRPLSEVEISRAEFDGDEIISLYSGDDLVLPCSENALEDVQEEMRGFIPQALKLTNAVTVQLNKMAMRIKELEDDLKGHKALLHSVREELAYEKTGTHALVKKIRNLETRVHGKPVVESGPDVRREHLMRDVNIAREVFGEGSKEHKTKQADLDRLLRAEVAYAEQKAKEDENVKLKKESD